MKLRTTAAVIFCMMTIVYSSCKEKSYEGSGDTGDVNSTAASGGGDISSDFEKPDEKKSFTDYCFDDLAGEPELQTTVSALQELAGEELCGVVAGKITRMDPVDLSGKGITDLRPLKGLTGIKNLILRGNLISDVTVLGGLTYLESVDLSGNPISDFSPLLDLSKLRTLKIGGTEIQSFEAVSGFTNITELDARSLFTITDPSPLGSLAKLERLTLTNTGLTSLSGLSTLTSLKELRISGSSVSDISAISGISTITIFEAAGIPLTVPGTVTAANCPETSLSQEVANFCIANAPN